MSSAPQPSATLPQVNPAAEVERLRALLERQPSCLMRIAVDGTLLAVSDAGLSLLGARQLAQAFGTSFIDRIRGDGTTVWADFAARVAHVGSASLECEVTDLGGVSRVVALQAVALPAHPDGVDSLFVTFRDVSTARRLEASLQAQTEQLARERDELRAALDATRAEREQLARALADLKAALTTAIDSTHLAQFVLDKGART